MTNTANSAEAIAAPEPDDALASGGPVLISRDAALAAIKACGPRDGHHLEAYRMAEEAVLALASASPASDGGFDLRRATLASVFKRMHQDVCYPQCTTDEANWFADEAIKALSAIPTVSPTPAGDMAGQDDVPADPMERGFEEICRENGIRFDRTDKIRDVRIDYHLPDHGVYVELKQYHSDRIAAQMKRVEEIIVIQGRGALRAFGRIAREGARREPVAGDGISDYDLAQAISDLLGYFRGSGDLPNSAAMLLRAAREHLRRRPLSAALGTDTPEWSPVTTPVTPLEEAMCRTFMRLEGRAAYADRTGDFYDCGLDESLPAWRAKLWWVREFLAAHPGLAASPEREAVLAEACEPWSFHTGARPDDDSPLSGVFGAGMAYTEKLLAGVLGVKHYEGGDGSEDFDSDATTTLTNILAEAGAWDKDEGRLRALSFGASPDGAGSGSEPVAWQWRSKAGPSGWGRHCPMGYDKPDSAPGYEDRPLYAAPPASVDAVAAVTEEMVDAAGQAFHQHGGRGWHEDAIRAALEAALRARQQATEARS